MVIIFFRGETFAFGGFTKKSVSEYPTWHGDDLKKQNCYAAASHCNISPLPRKFTTELTTFEVL